MIIWLLLIEHLVSELTPDPWVGGMTLALVVGQACLSDSYDRAARVVTMQAILCIKELLLTMSLHFILVTLLIDLCLLVEKSHAVSNDDTPGDTLLSFLPPGPRLVAQPKVL